MKSKYYSVIIPSAKSVPLEMGVSRFLCPGWFSRGQPITAALRV